MCTEPRPDFLPERTRMQQLWQNLRYSFRALRKNPGFTTVAILSLALGIGANVAIVTLVNALLLRDLPVPHPDRLVELSLVREGHKITFSYPMFRELDRGQRVFSGLLGWMDSVTPNVEVDGMFARGIVLAVTANFYSALGATPLLGRLLTSEDVILTLAQRRKSLSILWRMRRPKKNSPDSRVHFVTVSPALMRSFPHLLQQTLRMLGARALLLLWVTRISRTSDYPRRWAGC